MSKLGLPAVAALALALPVCLTPRVADAGEPEFEAPAGPPVRPEIEGGQNATTCQWPTSVTLFNGMGLCSGTLVHPRVVVYAAHCGAGNKTIRFSESAFNGGQSVGASCQTNPGYTGDQSLVDGPHSDLRRARAAAVNIVPTSTGAARATGLVLTKMKGKLDGIAMRVPIPDGSMTDFVGTLKKPATKEEVNAAFKAAAARGALAKVLEYSEDPLVSSDIVGSPASCTFDAGLTMSMGNLVKVCGWYDNEMGYSNRLVDLTMIMGTRRKKKAPAKKAPARRSAKK